MHAAGQRLAQIARLGHAHRGGAEAFPGAQGGGMFSYFTELNRKRPPAELLDFVCHTTCPLVHAGDDLSLTEGLERALHLPQYPGLRRQQALLAVPDRDIHAPNPYGAAPAENPQQGRVAMARTDPRASGADRGRYAGYLARAARPGWPA